MKSKQNQVLLFAIAMLIFSSCSDDNDNTQAFVGKWKIQSYEVFNCGNTALNTNVECGESGYCGEWEFTTDEKWIVTFFSTGAKINGTYTRHANTVDLYYAGVYVAHTISYSGDNLILTEESTETGLCAKRYIFVKI
jgi:hypothetical protein